MMTAAAHERFLLAKEFTATFSVPCKPWFVGVWDTVSSVGWSDNPLKVPFTANNSDIEHGRQAISIDEHRAFFRQNLWRRPPVPQPPAVPPVVGPKDLKQVWFPGVHCDIGGGYPEPESGLAKVALEWMLAEAHACQIVLNKDRTDVVLGLKGQGYVRPDPAAEMHESLTAAWWAAEFVLKKHYDWKTEQTGRRMNLFRRRTIPDGSSIHDSAYLRGQDYQQRLPSNVVRWRVPHCPY
jgi:uncharacterized protein (DUF2235 family)